MILLTGEYRNTLDDKGRVSLPSRLREDLPAAVLRITKGTEDCLRLIPLEEWEQYAGSLAGNLAESLAESLQESSSLSAQKRNALRYRVIAPSRQVELDRIGRIAIPQELRDFAGLSLGKECLIIGLGTYIEIWDIARYELFTEASMSVLEKKGPPAV